MKERERSFRFAREEDAGLVLDFIRRNKIYCKTTQEGDNDGN